MTESEVLIGEVIWYNERKGGGFVKIDDSGRSPEFYAVRLLDD